MIDVASSIAQGMNSVSPRENVKFNTDVFDEAKKSIEQAKEKRRQLVEAQGSAIGDMYGQDSAIVEQIAKQLNESIDDYAASPEGVSQYTALWGQLDEIIDAFETRKKTTYGSPNDSWMAPTYSGRLNASNLDYDPYNAQGLQTKEGKAASDILASLNETGNAPKISIEDGSIKIGDNTYTEYLNQQAQTNPFQIETQAMTPQEPTEYADKKPEDVDFEDWISEEAQSENFQLQAAKWYAKKTDKDMSDIIRNGASIQAAIKLYVEEMKGASSTTDTNAVNSAALDTMPE